MIKGFRDFLLRGNIVELAVAFVIGLAFVALITAFTTDFINPLIAAVGGGNVNGLAWQIVGGNPKSTVDFGGFLTAVITFVITAAVVYFLIVVPMNMLAERRARGQVAEPVAAAPDVALLIEIRDLLAARNF